MRINQYLARHTALSRRSADAAISAGRVEINGTPARIGDTVTDSDTITLDGQPISKATAVTTVLFHKPVGYVVSRKGQGSQTIYDLLPKEYQHLNPVGRLDKDSSGLLLLTNDGELANRLSHPRYEKQKIYEVTLDKPLSPNDQDRIKKGVMIEGKYLSKLELEPREDTASWTVKLSQGKNRQIRRTFSALGYNVVKLHRTNFGPYELGSLDIGSLTKP